MNNAILEMPLEFASMDELPTRIRQRVKELQLKGVTQAVIAARGNFSQGSLQNWMTGSRRMPRNMEQLAKALECSVRWLMTGEDSPRAYTDIRLIAEILEGLAKLPLPWEEQARIFVKAYEAASSQQPIGDSGQAENARLPGPSGTSET